MLMLATMAVVMTEMVQLLTLMTMMTFEADIDVEDGNNDGGGNDKNDVAADANDDDV